MNCYKCKYYKYCGTVISATRLCKKLQTMNTPILSQSEEEKAPWNEKLKDVEVYASISISRPFTIKVKENEDIENWSSEEIIDAIQEQYPNENLINTIESSPDWDIDEFIGY